MEATAGGGGGCSAFIGGGGSCAAFIGRDANSGVLVIAVGIDVVLFSVAFGVVIPAVGVEGLMVVIGSVARGSGNGCSGVVSVACGSRLGSNSGVRVMGVKGVIWWWWWWW